MSEIKFKKQSLIDWVAFNSDGDIVGSITKNGKMFSVNVYGQKFNIGYTLKEAKEFIIDLNK